MFYKCLKCNKHVFEYQYNKIVRLCHSCLENTNAIKKGMIVKPKWSQLEEYAFYVTKVLDNGDVQCQRQRIDGSRHETYYHWKELEIIGNASK